MLCCQFRSFRGAIDGPILNDSTCLCGINYIRNVGYFKNKILLQKSYSLGKNIQENGKADKQKMDPGIINSGRGFPLGKFCIQIA